MPDLEKAGTALRTRPGQERYVVPASESQVFAVDAVNETVQPSGFWASAGQELIRRPVFITSAVLIVFILVVVAFPGLFTGQDPQYASLDQALLPPGGEHWFGTDRQGHDIYARVVYGARASVLVGFLTTVIVFVVGGFLGCVAGFFGGWVDALISRLSDVFFGIPLILAAVVTMQMLQQRTIFTVVAVLALFGWPQVARIARSAAISLRNNEFITASEALGASRWRTLITHVMPNSLGPVIVISTISLGVFIVTEATLSYMGIGLPSTEVSWGMDIAAGQNQLRSGSPILFYPAGALAITVLAFMMLGDVMRDALDPKGRNR